MTSQLVKCSLCPFSKWWSAFSFWKKLMALLLDAYVRLLGLSSFPSALKSTFRKLGVTHILKQNTWSNDCAWKLSVKVYNFWVTSRKKWKNLPFSISLVFRLSSSFSEVTGWKLSRWKRVYRSWSCLCRCTILSPCSDISHCFLSCSLSVYWAWYLLSMATIF